MPSMSHATGATRQTGYGEHVHPSESLGDDPSRDAILSHFRIMPADPDDEPPDAP
jgi:hypothetical protein